MIVCTILLISAHGAIYTKEKLHRFGLIDNPSCPRCGEIETTEHRIITCDYVSRIWRELIQKVRPIIPEIEEENDLIKIAFGAVKNTNSTLISLCAEIIGLILRLKDNQTFLLRPKIAIENSISRIFRLEKNQEIKEMLRLII